MPTPISRPGCMMSRICKSQDCVRICERCRLDRKQMGRKAVTLQSLKIFDKRSLLFRRKGSPVSVALISVARKAGVVFKTNPRRFRAFRDKPHIGLVINVVAPEELLWARIRSGQ